MNCCSTYVNWDISSYTVAPYIQRKIGELHVSEEQDGKLSSLPNTANSQQS
jgi:hypothetical protein